MSGRGSLGGQLRQGQIRALSDSERILGQIERGEVRAGPSAAREIAARHQKAYGDVWATPDGRAAKPDPPPDLTSLFNAALTSVLKERA
ncbi:hypothetical protein [Streptomyces sp. CAU 1734]|uniref:hypothetical protein n=1 Tax=Streptomyces sp. CAU 1734 TaxID=3140360 RepID=UPI003260D185